LVNGETSLPETEPLRGRRERVEGNKALLSEKDEKLSCWGAALRVGKEEGAMGYFRFERTAEDTADSEGKSESVELARTAEGKGGRKDSG